MREYRVTVVDNLTDTVVHTHIEKWSDQAEDNNTPAMLIVRSAENFLRALRKKFGIQAPRPEKANPNAEPNRIMRNVPITNSSNVTNLTYKANGDLIVTFKASGDDYLYEGVPFEVFEDMCKSESVGKFLNDAIKGRYKYRRLEDDEDTQV